MSETTPEGTTPDGTQELSDDDIRQHPQDPAEGADPDDDQGEAVPRVHTQDPAEG